MADNSHSRELDRFEREAEQTRADLAVTLTELRNRLAPDEIKSQIVSHAQEAKSHLMDSVRSNVRETARDYGRSVREAAMNNPLPSLAIGVGLAWWLWRVARGIPAPAWLIGAGIAGLATSGNGRASGSRAYRDPYSDTWPRGYVPGGVAGYGYPASGEKRGSASAVAERAHEMAAGAQESARDMTERASESASRAGSAVSAAASRAASEMGRAMDQTSEAAARVASSVAATVSGTASSVYRAVAHSASHGGERARRVGARARNEWPAVAERHPFVVASLGLALGALAGAALRGTRVENRLMGESSDALKERTREAASEQYEKAEAVAEHAYRRAVAEAEAQGLTRRAMGEAFHEVGEKLDAVVESAREGARDEARRQGLDQPGTSSGQR